MNLQEAAGSLTQDLLIDGKDNGRIYRKAIDQLDKGVLKAVMSDTANNQSAAAALLGINRATLSTKLKRHDML